jgi:FG-GAP-like repeat
MKRKYMTTKLLKTVPSLLAGAGLLFLASSIGCGQGSAAQSSGGSGGSATGQGGSAGAVPPSGGGGAGGSAAAAGGSAASAGSGGGGLASVSGTAAAGGAGGATVSGGGATTVSSGGIAGGAGGASAGGGSGAATNTAITGGAGTTPNTAVTGGAGNSGGASHTGGTTATGGASASGGKPTGGTKATGGTTAIGGATATGGSASGTPVLVSTFDLKGVSGCPGLRLGDINGDGKMEIVVGQPVDQSTLDAYTPQRVVCITAFDLKGNKLWQYGTPGQFHTASSDIPIQVYDLDGDGKAEVFANMSTTEMTVLDGTTGKLLRTIPLPQAGANDGLAFANLRGKAWPQDIIVKTRYSQEWAMVGIDDTTTTPTTTAGTVLWHHKMLASDTGLNELGTGHYPLVYDWNGDGKDEVMCGYDFLNSDGSLRWSINTTSHPPLTMHADAIAAADIDANPANGYEVAVCGNVAAAFDWDKGTQLWQDTHTTEAQQMGIGDYRPDLPGLEVVLLDRLRTAAEGYKSNNVLVTYDDTLLWKENRPNNSGWLTVTENMNNWDGKGTDMIFSYRRNGASDGSGGTGTYLYDGYDNVVASFPYTGTSAQNFAQHADLCGDSKEEVIVYDETTVWIFANGGCDLDALPSKPGLPQQFHLHNWSIYTGWITPDIKFYTPGTPQ